MVEVKQQQKKSVEKIVRLSFLSFSYLVWRSVRNRAAKKMKQNEIIKYLELIGMLIWYFLAVAFDARLLQLSHLTVI